MNPLFGKPSSRAKKVKCKDPNAPKRNLSAYLLYQNAMRDQFKADNPGMSFGQLSSYTSYVSLHFVWFVPLVPMFFINIAETNTSNAVIDVQVSHFRRKGTMGEARYGRQRQIRR